MKITNIILTIGLSISTGIAMADYSFVVHNKTKDKIKKILTSEDKKTWGAEVRQLSRINGHFQGIH
jgi:hypothetical protein